MFLKFSGSILTIENHLQDLDSFSNRRTKCVDCEDGRNKDFWFSEKILQTGSQVVEILLPFIYYKILVRWFNFCMLKIINNTYFFTLLSKYN